MLKRVREWIQERIEAAILPHVQRCVTNAAETIDYERLALHLAGLTAFQNTLLNGVCKEVCSDDAFASRVAGEMDASEIAYHIDESDVASNVELDYSTFDIDMDAVAENIDYQQLCRALLQEMKARG